MLYLLLKIMTGTLIMAIDLFPPKTG